eukprot:TRINITY_DN2108_c0_g1_i1.p1 TRINITY_DN2108_c0_g1~~TRINITY_DN2108_c0_g1_i1.p1  ORF type:complete len:111 (+),score=28.92 TRINITY_DN2108_c0_g1_i1:313-645(+)
MPRSHYAAHALDTLLPQVRRMALWQKTADPASYINVKYTDMMKDPVGTVKKIYQHFKLAYTEEVEACVKATLAQHPQGLHGRREYTPEMYGTTADQIRHLFRDYIATFLS